MISDALVFFRPVEFSINERPKKSQEKDASYRANIWVFVFGPIKAMSAIFVSEECLHRF